MIKAIRHYAIPEKCKQGAKCPFEDIVNTLMPKAWEPRYTSLVISDEHLLRTDTTGAYTPQGGCTDGTYIYRALVQEDEFNTILQKIDMASGEIVLEKNNYSYGHANDMTFNKTDGYLYIAHSSSTSIVYKVDPATLEYVDTIQLSTSIWGIAYNNVDNLWIVGTVGSAYLSVYYSDWDFMYRIKPQNAYTGSVRQGVSCDENYIYVAVDNAYGTIEGNEDGSRIYVYTWNGMFIKSIHVPIKEIEWNCAHDGYLYIGTYEGRDANDIKSGKIYKIPLDLYPNQTVITGRPTDVSGGLNNLQRLPEGTPVRLWTGSVKGTGTITLKSVNTRLVVDEDSPFRYLRFRFKGANQQVFDWYPTNNGVVALRETDITDAQEDTTIRIREARVTFNKSTQTFVVETNFIEQIKQDVSENLITITKDREGALADLIEITQIWGVV